MEKTFDALRQADAAILVISGNRFGEPKNGCWKNVRHGNCLSSCCSNKSDESLPTAELQEQIRTSYGSPLLPFSTVQGDRQTLLEAVIRLIGKREHRSLLGGLLRPGQFVMLVTPIDSEAPTGRMILPQVQMLRDILDNRCTAIVLQPE